MHTWKCAIEYKAMVVYFSESKEKKIEVDATDN